MNKRIIIVACTIACGNRAMPPAEPTVVEPTTAEPTTVEPAPIQSMEPEISRNPPAQLPPAPVALPPPNPVPPPPPPIHTNPPRPMVPDIPVVAPAASSPARFTGGTWRGRHDQPQNPKLDGKTVYRAGDQTCFVHGEFPVDAPPRYPGQSPPAIQVDCPADMNDTVYDLCTGGVIYKHNNECGCFVMGNPPPPARSLSRCPAHSSTTESD